jgi:hypothetical protein
MLIDIHQAAAFVVRNIEFMLDEIKLSRRLASGESRHSNPAASEPIRAVLTLPKFGGELNTAQTGLVVTYDFVTHFDGLIEPTLTLSDYDVVIGILKFVVGELLKEMKSPAGKGPNAEPPKPKPEFRPVKYEFNPGFKVGIGAAFRPDIVWMLERLGISDQHLIPYSLFAYVLQLCEPLIAALGDKQKEPPEESIPLM